MSIEEVEGVKGVFKISFGKGTADRWIEDYRILCSDAVITTKNEHIQNGEWSKDIITYYLKKEGKFASITYYHSTRPVAGKFTFLFFENGEVKVQQTLYNNADFVRIPAEMIEYKEEIMKFVKKHARDLYERSVTFFPELAVKALSDTEKIMVHLNKILMINGKKYNGKAAYLLSHWEVRVLPIRESWEFRYFQADPNEKRLPEKFGGIPINFFCVKAFEKKPRYGVIHIVPKETAIYLRGRDDVFFLSESDYEEDEEGNLVVKSLSKIVLPKN